MELLDVEAAVVDSVGLAVDLVSLHFLSFGFTSLDDFDSLEDSGIGGGCTTGRLSRELCWSFGGGCLSLELGFGC